MLSSDHFCPQESFEHSSGVGGRSGGLSPSSLIGSQSSEILGWVREAAQAKAGCSQTACGMEDVLQLLRILYIIGSDTASNARTLQEGTADIFSLLDFIKALMQLVLSVYHFSFTVKTT